ncbi:hypothetical protein ACN4EE_10820 [Geminocystis sp. CENA526]|uniref:hypothetical protein n=1 Tax=Geminocystis sp. CENA526 TaxID=1355871 RepID=UPI003D6EE61E
MSNLQLPENATLIEQRLSNLEQELSEVKNILNSNSQKYNWWLKIAGTFENDPTFDEVEKLGQEWRKSAD